MTDYKGYPTQQTPPPQYTAGVQQPQVVVTTQPYNVNLITTFREVPVPMKCTFCQADILTKTEYEMGNMPWVVCAVIFFIGCFCPLVWLGCCFIPFCITSLKDVVHSCPNCNQMVGRYNRMG